MKKLKFHNETRKVKELVPYEYNPRKLTPEKKAVLRKSLEKFDLAEIPVINLDNTIVAGHQRVVVLLELGRGEDAIDVRVPNRTLTEDELKEYNVRSNIQIGEWDEEILKDVFKDLDLEEFGFDTEAAFSELVKTDNEIEKFNETFKEIDNKPKYPIVAKFNEKYSAVIIVAENTTDLTFLQTVLKLNTEASYKSQRIGQTFVLTTKKLQKLWEEKSK